ncbi:MAG: precorrin-6A reductase [Cyanobacteria bacterium P01_E01_bin.34]
MTIWLIGGTSESKQMAQCLSNWGHSWLVTITTPLAAQLYTSLPGEALAQRLTPATIERFISTHAIQGIIDASHPFATQISLLAIQASKIYSLPYIRIERPSFPLHPSTLLLPNFEAVLQPIYLARQRVLLTTGVKTLHLFADWHQCSHLWARILPNESSKQQALATGFPPDRLIQQRLPAVQERLHNKEELKERERQLWRSLNISTVVTKEAGAAGGFALKQELALELGVKLIAIGRPDMNYPLMANDVDQVRAFCQHIEQP